MITGNLISQPTFGQLEELTKELDQKDKEKFLELGEQEFRKDCCQSLNIGSKLAEGFMKDLPKDLTRKICEDKIS